MGSKFWYYPDPPGNLLVEIDLGVTITDLNVPTTRMQQSMSTAFTGTRTIVQMGGVQETRIRWEFGSTTTNRTLRRKLVAMLNHMDRGGSVMFAVDSARYFAGFLQADAVAGTTSFGVDASTESFVTSVSLAQVETVIRSGNPNCLIEMPTVTTHTRTAGSSSSTVEISPGLVYDYVGEAWVLIREMGSWPALRLPEGEHGRDHLTGEHENAFILDLPVEEDDTSLQLQFDNRGQAFAGSTYSAAPPALAGGPAGGWWLP